LGTDGEETDVWVRSTIRYRKIDGKWMIAPEHVSVPFYMYSGKASVDLRP
jgi:ketosteroid isomerase-like protein